MAADNRVFRQDLGLRKCPAGHRPAGVPGSTRPRWPVTSPRLTGR